MTTQRRLDQTKMTMTINSKKNSPSKLHTTVNRSGETNKAMEDEVGDSMGRLHDT